MQNMSEKGRCHRSRAMPATIWSLKDVDKGGKLDRAAGSGHGLRDTSISQDRTSVSSSSQGELHLHELPSQGLCAETPSHSSLRVRAAGDPSESCRCLVLAEFFLLAGLFASEAEAFRFKQVISPTLLNLF